jgi:hypothetical protein
MGLCIYYSGKIKDAESLPLLIEEVKDIAIVNKWDYHIYETSFPNETLDSEEHIEPIYGISFAPPECESVTLTFLSNGVMVHPGCVKYFGNSKNETQKNYIYHPWTKTQYAGIVIHATIINIFRHLNSKYLKDFKMMDESGYWETGDESIMQANFKQYDALLDNFVLSMQTFPVQKDENMISYFERLMGEVRKLKE